MIERTEETQALDVVHMEMREEDVDPISIRLDLCPESTNARTCVEDQHRAVVSAHFNGRCISSVPARLLPWGRQRSAGPEERHAHHSASSQKRATAPRNSP